MEVGGWLPPWWSVTTTSDSPLASRGCKSRGDGGCRWLHAVQHGTGEKELYDISNGPRYAWKRRMSGDPCMLNNLARKAFPGHRSGPESTARPASTRELDAAQDSAEAVAMEGSGWSGRSWHAGFTASRDIDASVAFWTAAQAMARRGPAHRDRFRRTTYTSFSSLAHPDARFFRLRSKLMPPELRSRPPPVTSSKLIRVPATGRRTPAPTGRIDHREQPYRLRGRRHRCDTRTSRSAGGGLPVAHPRHRRRVDPRRRAVDARRPMASPSSSSQPPPAPGTPSSTSG